MQAPIENEHLSKLTALSEKGECILGSVEELNHWLKKPFLDREERPIDWLNSPAGVDLVLAELDRLAHGYVI